MAKVMPGRFTAVADEPFVVFMIGMRVNRLFALTSWVPIAMSMQPMIIELYKHKEMGFLAGELFFSWRGITVLQYWRSFEHLEAYSKGELHMKAWKRFYDLVGTSDSVGIWHETYLVEPGKFESFYNNMPMFGAAKATSHVPIGRDNHTARGRLKRETQPDSNDFKP